MMNAIKQNGFTLIEMMVGLLLGLLVTGIVIATFVQSKGSYNQDQEVARMQENGRFVLTTLAREMSMAGFLGNMQINDEEVLNIGHLYDTIQTLKKKGEKKVLLQLPGNIQLPLDLEKADELDREIKKKYGILYMKTAGGFLK